MSPRYARKAEQKVGHGDFTYTDDSTCSWTIHANSTNQLVHNGSQNAKRAALINRCRVTAGNHTGTRVGNVISSRGTSLSIDSFKVNVKTTVVKTTVFRVTAFEQVCMRQNDRDRDRLDTPCRCCSSQSSRHPPPP